MTATDTSLRPLELAEQHDVATLGIVKESTLADFDTARNALYRQYKRRDYVHAIAALALLTSIVVTAHLGWIVLCLICGMSFFFNILFAINHSVSLGDWCQKQASRRHALAHEYDLAIGIRDAFDAKQ